MKEILSPESQSPNGVRSHLIDVYLDELSTVGGREVRSSAALGPPCRGLLWVLSATAASLCFSPPGTLSQTASGLVDKTVPVSGSFTYKVGLSRTQLLE